jgi:hypothetical protein
VARLALGSIGDGLPAGGNGKVDLGDYDFWRGQFGTVTGGSGSVATGLPEPAGMALLLFGAVGVLAGGRHLRMLQ